MIVVDGASARLGTAWITGVTMTFGHGVHSVIGGPEDGGPLLLAVLAGAVRLRRGRVRVFGRGIHDARLRSKIGRVPLVPALPLELRVREFFAVASRIRGDEPRPALERLSHLGLAALDDRPIRSLSRAEARALALAEAVTSSSVQALLVEEPRVGMDPRAAGRISAALRAKAQNGCIVVLSTASMPDASDLADDHTLMRRGVVVAHLRSLDEVVGFSPDGARLQVLLRSATDARTLVAALAHDTSIEALERDDARVQLRGPDAVWLARAAAAAALEAGVEVVSLGVGAPAVEEARAAAAGIAAATYEAAYRRTRAERSAEPPAVPAPPEGAP